MIDLLGEVSCICMMRFSAIPMNFKANGVHMIRLLGGPRASLNHKSPHDPALEFLALVGLEKGPKTGQGARSSGSYGSDIKM